MRYKLEDLKEGYIIDFKNNRYGIITRESPMDNELVCVYSTGGWDHLSTVINFTFDLYESKYPIFSFVNLLKGDLDDTIRYKGLIPYEKPIKQITKQEIAKLINLNIDEFNIIN
jgi:hypothetical protein